MSDLVWSHGAHHRSSDVVYTAEDPSPSLKHGAYRIRRHEGGSTLVYERWRDEHGGAVPIQHVTLGKYRGGRGLAAAKSAAQVHHDQVSGGGRAPSKSEIERDVQRVVEGRGEDVQDSGRLFIGTYPTGILYADRRRERHGDYLRLAFLPFRTLELEWEKVPIPLALREEIARHARSLQARRGEHYEVTTSGQTVLLGK